MRKGENIGQDPSVVWGVVIEGCAVLTLSVSGELKPRLDTYPFRVMVCDEDVGAVSRNPTSVVEILKARNCTTQKGVFHCRCVSEPDNVIEIDMGVWPADDQLTPERRLGSEISGHYTMR